MVHNVEVSHKGLYECEGIDENGDKFIAQSKVFIMGK